MSCPDPSNPPLRQLRSLVYFSLPTEELYQVYDDRLMIIPAAKWSITIIMMIAIMKPDEEEEAAKKEDMLTIILMVVKLVNYPLTWAHQNDPQEHSYGSQAKPWWRPWGERSTDQDELPLTE